MQRPFDAGDWIQIDRDGLQIGRVIEINWRATRLLTIDRVEVTVPNNLLARAPIQNFSKPTKLVRRSARQRTQVPRTKGKKCPIPSVP